MAGRSRRGYLDLLRGVAVLIMIEAHLVDSWTRTADRDGTAYSLAIILGGFGAPLFLFLAGVSVALSAGAKARRGSDRGEAAAAVAHRGAQIFGLAFLFRVQAWILGWSSPRALLKVDILNIMGPAIAAAAGLWRLAGSVRGRAAAFGAATLAIAFLTPVIRLAPIGALPDAVEAYIRPVPYLSNFVFFPWVAFVFAGALAGVLIDATHDRAHEVRVVRALTLAGAITAAGAFGASFLPTPYAHTYFWTTSPAFFFLRTGLLTASIGLAYLWGTRPGGEERWSPLQQLGRTSLFIYWIHVELIYGHISRPLHGRLTLTQAAVAYVLFTALMLVCSVGKDRLAARWRGTSPRRLSLQT
jgi:uncharacterized membrane protein